MRCIIFEIVERKEIKQQMKRIKVFTIEEAEAIIKEKSTSSECSNHLETHQESVTIEGYAVYPRSLRYKTFIEKGYTCVCCGRKGAYYALECDEKLNPNRAHFNLYSEDDVLMTKDHIFPKSKGGKDCIENMQTMCVLCNKQKGSRIPENYNKEVVEEVIKPVNNRSYVWCGNRKFKSISAADNYCCKGNKLNFSKTKKRIRDSIAHGTLYYGEMWRYGKEI